MSELKRVLLYRIPWIGIVFVMLMSNYLYYIWRKFYSVRKNRGTVFFVSMLIISIYVIVKFTLLDRPSNCSGNFNFIPFENILRSQFEESVVQTMVLNMFLFYPLGLSLLAILQNKNYKRNRIIIFCVALLLSCTIEIVQCYYGLGTAEVDDIICNVLGAMFALLTETNIYRIRK